MAGRIPDETKRQVADLYTQGVKVTDIEEQTGLPRPTIYYVLRNQGLRPSRTARGAADATTPADMLADLAALERRVGRLQAAVRVLGGPDLDPATVGLSKADLPDL